MSGRIMGLWWAAIVMCLGAGRVHAAEPLRVVSSIAPVNLLVQGLVGPEVSAQTLLNAKSRSPRICSARVGSHSNK